MIKFVIAIPLIMHGLANLAGVFAPWMKALQGFKDAPWLFSSGVTFASTAGKAFSLVWLASSICLVAAGVGLLMEQAWWSTAAVAGCLCSLAAILPWLKAVVPGAYVGAIFDVILLIYLLTPLKSMLPRIF